MKIWLKIALNAVRLPKFEPVNGISWSPRKIMVKDLRQRSGLAWYCACAESCVVFNTRPYTDFDLPDNSILITANMQSETGFPSSHQLKSYVAYKSRWNWRRALSCQRMLAFLLTFLTDWLIAVLRPIQHKIGHFLDVSFLFSFLFILLKVKGSAGHLHRSIIGYI